MFASCFRTLAVVWFQIFVYDMVQHFRFLFQIIPWCTHISAERSHTHVKDPVVRFRGLWITKTFKISGMH